MNTAFTVVDVRLEAPNRASVRTRGTWYSEYSMARAGECFNARHLLREMNEEFGTTLIMVTHDPVVALSTRRILTLRDGRIEHDEAVEATYLDEMQQISRTHLGQLLFGERAEVLTVPLAAVCVGSQSK